MTNTRTDLPSKEFLAIVADGVRQAIDADEPVRFNSFSPAKRTDLPPGHKLPRDEYMDELDAALARARNIRSLPTEIKRKGETFAEMRKRLGLRVVK